MLHEGQPASATPLREHQSMSYPDIPPARTSNQPQHVLPFADVRSATAGEHDDVDDSPTTPIQSIPPYLLPRPGASATTPAYSAGADLLRMLQQGSPPPAQTSTMNQQQRSGEYEHQQHQHQQQNRHEQEQYPRDATPPPSAPRSMAAEQERFLKNFLAIGDSTGSMPSPSTPPPASATRAPLPEAPSPTAGAPLAAAAAKSNHPSSATATDTGGGRAKNQPNNKGRGKERGKGRGQRGGRHGSPTRASVGAGRGGQHHTENAVRGRGRGQQGGRGEQGRGGTGRDAGRDSSKKGARGGGKNGGGGGGKGAPAASPKYAWSAFQNSPDPKSIPIPSLQHFSRTPGVSSGEDGVALSAESSNWREGALGSGGVGGETVEPAGPAGGMRTPTSNRTKPESRSSAKKAEDDIKRMLGLN